MPLTLTKIPLKLGYGTYGAGGAYKPPIDVATLYEIIAASCLQGVTLIDTAAVYGATFGQSERDLGAVLKKLAENEVCTRDNLYIATKCGIRITSEGYQVISTADELISSCSESLERLQIEAIDLFYLHRVAPGANMDELAQALSNLIDQKKIRSVGLSEVDEETIISFSQAMERCSKKECFVAVQSEYALTNRAVGNALLPICQALNLTFFAYSSLAKGFLADETIRNPDSVFNTSHSLFAPQLDEAHKQDNLALLAEIKMIATQVPCTVAQLSLAWLMQQPNVFPLISTSNYEHLIENIHASTVYLSNGTIDQINALPAIQGSRRSQILRNLSPQMGRYSPTPTL